MKQERNAMEALEAAVVTAYAATFIARWDMYPVQHKGSRLYHTEHQPLRPDLVAAHLAGKITLGTYALSPDNQAKWLCFDADNDVEWAALWKAAHHLEEQGLAVYPEASRRGGHLWLFLHPLDGAQARQFGKALAEMYELVGIELYPKQNRLVDGPGSFVRLPLGIHQADGHRHYFLTLSGAPMAPTIREQIKLLAFPTRIPQAFVEEMIADAPPATKLAPTPAFPQTPFSATPPTAPLSERLKASISVHEFVSQYVDLDTKGRAHCPFHDDQHKSFGVNESHNFWHCYAGCGGGSIIHFWQKWREVHGQDPAFVPTITELAEMLL